MIHRSIGLVKKVEQISEHLLVALVDRGGKEEKAYVYPDLTGSVDPGCYVWLNTTACDLDLGSGGYHFVMGLAQAGGREDRKDEEKLPSGRGSSGHIMKLRYTPGQLKVFAVEEPGHPAHEIIKKNTELDGTPVICGSLHSMLVPCVCGIKAFNRRLRVGYVMTDGGALPLFLSRAVRELRKHGYLCGTVTAGHAFGGDYEAVTVYSALLAARYVLGADIIVVLMGPGVVGTGTKWGNTGLESGQIINAVASLNGSPYTIPRLSFADRRRRHRSISHHTLTALEKVALAPTALVFPFLSSRQKKEVLTQLAEHDLSRHCLLWERGEEGVDLALTMGFPLEHMGRGLRDDPAFFLAAAAAGKAAAKAASRFPRPTNLLQTRV